MSQNIQPFDLNIEEFDAQVEAMLALNEDDLLETIRRAEYLVLDIDESDDSASEVEGHNNPNEAGSDNLNSSGESMHDSDHMDIDESESSSSGYQGSSSSSWIASSTEDQTSGEETLIGDMPQGYIYSAFAMESLHRFLEAWYHTVQRDEGDSYRIEGLQGRFEPAVIEQWMNEISLFAFQSLVYAQGVATMNNDNRVNLRHMQEVINRYRRGMADYLPILDQYYY